MRSDHRIEYETVGLDVADVASDPMSQFERWYSDAVAAECTEPSAAVVSTVDDEGGPDARFVLLRGVDQRGWVFYTNLRSAKSEQLSAHPVAALTVGWLELHRQVRVRGRVEPVSDEEADAYFAGRPRGAQLGAWASPQSQVLSARSELETAVEQETARFDGLEIPRPAFWSGWRVAPDRVEFWQGRPDRLHDRIRYRRDGEAWTLERLAP